MRMRNIIMLMLVMMLLPSLVLAQTTPTYSDEPSEDFDKTDITIFNDNTYKEYEGYDLDLPAYVPHSVWAKLKRNNATRTKQVIGRHVPRFFDGEKYTDFRADGFNPDNLTETEKAQMDSINIYVQHEIQEGGEKEGTCELTALLQTAKQYSIPGLNQSQDTTLIYEVPYAYDMGYFFVPEIRNIMLVDCDNILAGSEWSSRDHICKRFTESLTLPGNLVSTSVQPALDLAVSLRAGNNVTLEFGSVSIDYEYVTYDPYDVYAYNGSISFFGDRPSLQKPCVAYQPDNNIYQSFNCYTEDELESTLSLLDDWMIKFLAGSYEPTSCEDALSELVTNDELFSKCISVIDNNKNKWFLASSIYSEYISCQEYVNEKRQLVCSLSESYDRDSVEDLIWDHYRDSYKIKKGTNLYPFNVDRALIRCHPNAIWHKLDYSDILLPNQQSPTIFCDYSNMTEEIIEIEFKFIMKHNPVWATIVGADSINEAYDTEFWQYLFSTENYLGVDFVNVTVEDYNQFASISSSFNVNRSQTNGCFVYMNLTQAGTVTSNIDEAITQAQENAKNVGDSLKEQKTVQLSLLRSELEKVKLFGFLETIAELIFRIIMVMSYAVSISLFFYALKLIPDSVRSMVNNIRNVGTSKAERTSLLKEGGK